jgi:hypothetical protein
VHGTDGERVQNEIAGLRKSCLKRKMLKEKSMRNVLFGCFKEKANGIII